MLVTRDTGEPRHSEKKEYRSSKLTGVDSRQINLEELPGRA